MNEQPNVKRGHIIERLRRLKVCGQKLNINIERNKENGLNIFLQGSNKYDKNRLV